MPRGDTKCGWFRAVSVWVCMCYSGSHEIWSCVFVCLQDWILSNITKSVNGPWLHDQYIYCDNIFTNLSLYVSITNNRGKKEWKQSLDFIQWTNTFKKQIKHWIMSFLATWMDLEIVILNEVSQTEKDKYTISLTCSV